MKRNPKSIIALVMCVLTAFGTMIYNNVSAAGNTSSIDSYDSLVEIYGTATDDEGRTDGFVYLGTEFYEEDGNLTDYVVNPGDKLTVKLYLKSNMYTSDFKLVTLFDNSFFDVKVVDDGVDSDNYDENGYIYLHKDGDVNRNHPMVVQHRMIHSVTTKDVVNALWIKNTCGFDDAYLSSVDLVDNQSFIDTQTANIPYEMTSDEWLISYYVHVKDGLAEGTSGIVASPEVLWQSYINPVTGKHDTRKQAKVPVRHKSEQVGGAADFIQMAQEMDNGTLDHFIIDDMNHEFVIGAETATTETTTRIPEYTTEAPTFVNPVESTTYPVTFTDPVVTRDPEMTAVDSAAIVRIKTPSTYEIRYGDSIILHAITENIPENAKLEWSADNTNFSFTCSTDRKTCKIYPRESGNTVFTVKVISEDNRVLNEDSVTMTSNAGFLWRIIAFFKQLFGLNQVIPECFITL